MGFFEKHGRLMLPLGLAALGAIACYQVLPREARAVEILLVGFPDADVFGQRLRPLLLGLLFFLPAIAAVFYAFADSLDRYLVRRFLPLFALCLGSLLMIWLLIDLGDNLADLRRSPNFIAATARFYVLQFPTIFVLIVPYALLLSLLYCLGKMSKSREIIAIIQTGRGMVRLVAPLLVASLFLSAACLIFNYHWAPWAEGYKDILLARAKGARASQATNVLYYESSARRLWKVGEFPLDNTGVAPLLGVVVTQTHPDGRLKSRLISPQATWDRKSTQWTFENPVVEHFHCLPPEGRRPGTGNPPPTFEKLSEPIVKSGWHQPQYRVDRRPPHLPHPVALPLVPALHLPGHRPARRPAGHRLLAPGRHRGRRPRRVSLRRHDLRLQPRPRPRRSRIPPARRRRMAARPPLRARSPLPLPPAHDRPTHLSDPTPHDPDGRLII